jgi:hypothetical protein
VRGKHVGEILRGWITALIGNLSGGQRCVFEKTAREFPSLPYDFLLYARAEFSAENLSDCRVGISDMLYQVICRYSVPDVPAYVNERI